MVVSRSGWGVCLAALVLLAGCSDKSKDDVSKERLEQMSGEALKELVPVSGVVKVDGAPQAGVNLYLYDEAGTREITSARTDAEGKYCWSTYQACDGLPAGSYLLAFDYIPKPRKNDTGVDLFRGKYRNPRTGKYKLTVVAGTPQTDVNYEFEMGKSK